MRYYDRNTAKNKVKEPFVQQPRYGWNWQDEDYIYYANHLCYFRRIRTTNEIRQLPDRETLIEYNIRVRGRRSMRQLPSAWDDIWNTGQRAEKSWKHNSKRKKQWKYE